ncbi:MAG: hypothetical protein ACHQFW_05665 [Chitinophagales bacterium]
MKKLILPSLLAITICFSSCNSEKKTENGEENGNETTVSSENGKGKYQIKSGNFTTKAQTQMMGSGMDTYTITYFDDYGAKELTESVTKMDMGGMKMETHTYSLVKDQTMYSWEQGKTTGTKYNFSDMMKNMNYETFSEEMKKQYNYKELGTETVLGKTCKKISVEIQKGSSATVCTWKGISMRSEVNVAGMPMTMEVTELNENASTDASKFEIPSDVTFTEMKMPGQ